MIREYDNGLDNKLIREYDYGNDNKLLTDSIAVVVAISRSVRDRCNNN